ncbi:MAG: site-specific DNA-methyltransferase, partial [Synergistaceae bacterium]|nr:site-specific DNA-methyltransferase [Synergistaceae bacterium]
MENLKMHTPDLADENFKKLAGLFPNAVTETIIGYDENGKAIIERAIDADVLRQEISSAVVEGSQERYQFTWPDKKKSVVLANQPIAKTLRLDREKSVGRDGTPGSIDTENIYIEGDNLDALKLLQETYLGQVKMIYIDPPYNTGKDFIYEDDFSQDMGEYLADSGQFDEDGGRLVQNPESNGRFHTDWLNMIYPRLRIAKDLLSDDGVIFISIDDNEQSDLKLLCDEIFGDKNYISD